MDTPFNTPEVLIPHLARFRDDDWDCAVLERTKLCLADSLACVWSGVGLRHFLQSLEGFKKASHTAVTPDAIAYIYGQGANAFDFDDMLEGHPGAPIIATIMAVAIGNELSLDRVLRGIAGGMEAHDFLCRASIPSPQRGGIVRSIGVWDTISAALGALIALGADNMAIEQAIGVAAAHSYLPWTGKWYERPVPAMKNNMGWVAKGALLSVQLVLTGQTGITNVLDGKNGMWAMAGTDSWKPSKRLLEEKPAILRLGFKQYPACWHLQEYLKSFEGLLEKLEEDEPVIRVSIAGPKDVEKFCDGRPIGTADLAFSLPALFSLLAAGVKPGPEWEEVVVRKLEWSYQEQEERGIHMTTPRRTISASVRLSAGHDLASSGLDAEGVLKKFDRWGPKNDALTAFMKGGSNVSAVAAQKGLYDAVTELVTALLKN